MNPLEFFYRLVMSAWPFVKEMVLEGKSLEQVFKSNKRRAFFAIAIMVSFGFNLVNIGVDVRMVAIADRYLKLEQQYQAQQERISRLQGQLTARKTLCPDTSAPPGHPPDTPAAINPPLPSDSTSDSYRDLHDTFGELQTRKP